MSGSLAQAVVGAQSACKVYTNSSGNPASITIHAQALDPDKNSCLSLKYSSTDACVLCSSTVSTLDAPLAQTSYISETGGALCGFAFAEDSQNNCVTCNCFVDRNFNWCDATDAATYKWTTGCIRTMNYCSLPNFGNLNSSLQPAAKSQFGLGRQGCVSSGRYANHIIAQKQLNYPSFITGSGEAWERQGYSYYFVRCCNQSCSASGGHCGAMVRMGQDDICCCQAWCGSRECRRRYFYCGFECFTSCNPDYTCFCSLSPWVSQDIWSDSTPIFWVGYNNCPVPAPGNCRCFGMRHINNLLTGASGECVGRCCAANQLLTDCDQAIWLECCSCCGTCCCDVWQQRTSVANKYVMAGCDVAFFTGFQSDFSTQVITYDKSFDCGFSNCQACRMYSMGRFCGPAAGADYCCIFYPAICNMGSPMVKWLFYNPYTDCNYFEIMNGDLTLCPNTPAAGIYSIDTSYTPYGAGCIIGSCYVNCCFQCKSMADWLSAGFIKCVSGTPSAWSEKTSAYESSTQPQLVAECCFGIWWQCHTFGNVPTEGGWNGCMLHYRSKDLITWEKVENETLELQTAGSGNAICSTTIKNTGSDITKNVNHYFNSDNCVGNDGTLEYKVSANRLERTGIVLSNSDKLYVSNNSSTPIAIQVWGYDE
jgi:hypothetical protein